MLGGKCNRKKMSFLLLAFFDHVDEFTHNLWTLGRRASCLKFNSLYLFPSRSAAGERMMDVAPDASDRWAAGETTVLEKEALALGSRAPGPQSARQANSREPTGTQIRHLGVEPLIRASRANLSRPVWGSEESVSLASDYYGSTFSLYRGRTFSVPL